MSEVIERARRLRRLIERNASAMPAADAVDAVELFRAWKPGVRYHVGENGNWYVDAEDTGIPQDSENGLRLQYQDSLYMVRQEHTSQSDWTPDATPALYMLVVADAEAGTSADNPIPWGSGMEVKKDLYYVENGVLYIGIRDSGIPIYCTLYAVIANYVNPA